MKNNEIYEYIIQNKEIFDNIIEFLENNVEDDLENINTIKFISQKIDNNDKLIELLQMISNIADNFHRNEILFKKTYHLIEHFKNQIKQTLSNVDI